MADFRPGDTGHEYYTSHDRPLTEREAAELNRRFAEAHYAARVNKLNLGRAAIIKLDAHRRKA